MSKGEEIGCLSAFDLWTQLAAYRLGEAHVSSTITIYQQTGSHVRPVNAITQCLMHIPVFIYEQLKYLFIFFIMFLAFIFILKYFSYCS